MPAAMFSSGRPSLQLSTPNHGNAMVEREVALGHREGGRPRADLKSRESLDGALPELRAKLEKRLSRIHGDAQQAAQDKPIKQEASEPQKEVNEVDVKAGEGYVSTTDEDNSDQDFEPADRNRSARTTWDFSPEKGTGRMETAGVETATSADSKDVDATVCASACDVRNEETKKKTTEEEVSEISKQKPEVKGPDSARRSQPQNSCLGLLGQMLLWSLLFLVALCGGALSAQPDQEAWRESAAMVMQEYLPRYELEVPQFGSCIDDSASCSRLADSEYANSGEDPDVEGRLSRSKRYAQQKSRMLNNLALAVVCCLGGSIVTGLVLLFICWRSAVGVLLSLSVGALVFGAMVCMGGAAPLNI